MRSKGANGVGRITIDVELANNDDLALARRGAIAAAKVRRKTVRAVVDSCATKLVLPEKIVKELGLPRGDKIKVRYA